MIQTSNWTVGEAMVCGAGRSRQYVNLPHEDKNWPPPDEVLVVILYPCLLSNLNQPLPSLLVAAAKYAWAVEHLDTVLPPEAWLHGEGRSRFERSRKLSPASAHLRAVQGAEFPWKERLRIHQHPLLVRLRIIYFSVKLTILRTARCTSSRAPILV